MSIKCGHCGDAHESVAAVRDCYGLAGEYGPFGPPTPTERAAAVGTIARDDIVHQTYTASNPAATERQQSYVNALRKERGLEPLTTVFTKRWASTEIERLLKMPKSKHDGKPNANLFGGVDISGIREGRYAVEMDGTLKFYRVDKPDEGRWAGYTFVKVQASDDLYPVRGAAANAVLAAIAVDPPAAMLRYGLELGQCGHCGRTLTNEESRSAGIGPICRGKMGSWM